MAVSRVGEPATSARLPVVPRHEVVKLGVLFGTLAFFQGIDEPTDGLCAQPLRALLMSRGRSGSQVAGIAGLIALPWVFKPLFGLLTDFVPWMGMRRRSYLLLMTSLVTVGFLAAFLAGDRVDNEVIMLTWIFVVSASVAFADVSADALMIELAQPLQLTGKLQAIQWACLYASGIVIGLLGGALAEYHYERWSLLACGVGSLIPLGAVVLLAREPPRSLSPARALHTPRTILRHASRSPTLLSVGGFLFLWNFNPFSNAVLHVHLTRGLGFREQMFGTTVTLTSLASIAACLLYSTYCRRIPMRLLIRISIGLGVVSTLGYLWVRDERSLELVTLFTGFTYMTATLIQLDLAARSCPSEMAGTLFAGLMSLENLAAALSTWLGGILYQAGLEFWGPRGSFQLLVVIGSLFSSSCWLLLRVPSLRKAYEDPPASL